MAAVNIDGKEYMTENMSEESKATLISLQFVQAEQKRLAKVSYFKSPQFAVQGKLYGIELREISKWRAGWRGSRGAMTLVKEWYCRGGELRMYCGNCYWWVGRALQWWLVTLDVLPLDTLGGCSGYRWRAATYIIWQQYLSGRHERCAGGCPTYIVWQKY